MRVEDLTSQKPEKVKPAPEGGPFMFGWRPVVGREGEYEISSDGRLRKIDGTLCGLYRRSDGYIVARLSGSRRFVRVHRLVAKAFIPNPENKPYVGHLDHSTDNNIVTNLVWCTQKENLEHADKAGRMRRDNRKGKRVSPEPPS